MLKEIWKDIVGYEGLYKVSNLGYVKSINRTTSHNRILKGKLLKMIVDKDNYFEVSLCKNNKKKNYRVHRLVAETFISNPDNLPQVNHIDGNKQNNNVCNLEWVTCKQNIQHSFKMGLSFVKGGETHHCAKLSQKQVDFIRNNYKFRDKNFSTVALANFFGVTPSTITLITKNKNWKKEK